MDSSIEKVIELKETKDFLLTARNYCAFIESTDTTDIEYLRKLQSLLLTLYLNATNLPWTTLEHEEEFKDKLSKEEFDKILSVIADKVGQNRYYWEVFDPTNEKDTEAVCGDLVDDLGDIYKDMKYGLMIFDLGTMASKEDAVWDMKFGFEKHWGRHAISALKTIHFLLGSS
ncbi:MAG: DUF5063 domain-containing protein [Cyclobacteriaceae bacterium]|nr:DUF5063 domain-containing protein [Cyclobacteriaceae bacterium]